MCEPVEKVTAEDRSAVQSRAQNAPKRGSQPLKKGQKSIRSSFSTLWTVFDPHLQEGLRLFMYAVVRLLLGRLAKEEEEEEEEEKEEEKEEEETV